MVLQCSRVLVEHEGFGFKGVVDRIRLWGQDAV